MCWNFICFQEEALGAEGNRVGSLPKVGLSPHETHYRNGLFPTVVLKNPKQPFPKQAASLRAFVSAACRTRCKCRYPVVCTPAAKYLNVFGDGINFSVFWEEFFHLKHFSNLKIRVLMTCTYCPVSIMVKYSNIIRLKSSVFFDFKH